MYVHFSATKQEELVTTVYTCVRTPAGEVLVLLRCFYEKEICGNRTECVDSIGRGYYEQHINYWLLVLG